MTYKHTDMHTSRTMDITLFKKKLFSIPEVPQFAVGVSASQQIESVKPA